jgi:hypothetical protein
MDLYYLPLANRRPDIFQLGRLKFVGIFFRDRALELLEGIGDNGLRWSDSGSTLPSHAIRCL